MPNLNRELRSVPHLASRGLWTPAHAAERLGVSTQTLRNWTRAGRLTDVRLPGADGAPGKQRFYRAAEIEGLVEPVSASARVSPARPSNRQSIGDSGPGPARESRAETLDESTRASIGADSRDI